MNHPRCDATDPPFKQQVVKRSNKNDVNTFDEKNQRAPKLALFEGGVDIGLVLLMYDALKNCETPTSAAIRRVPKFVLQLAVFFRCYHGHDREFEA